MAKILITGSQGTLGQPLLKELRKRNHEVWGCDLSHQKDEKYIRCDISEFRQIEKVLSEKFDLVYNLAAEFGRVNGEEYYEKVWKTNVIGLRNILELQRKFGFKLIHTSSSEVYGDIKAEYLREDMSPAPQENDYAISKWVNEIQCRNFRKKYGNQIMILRLFNCFSPDTNVLTPEGLRNIKDFKIGDSIYTLNPKTHQVEISKVIQTQKFEYKGDLVFIKGIGKDFLVTPNHKMYLKYNASPNFRFIKASKLGKSQMKLVAHKPVLGGLRPLFFSLWDYITDKKIILIKMDSLSKRKWTKAEKIELRKAGFKYGHNDKIKYMWMFKKDFPEGRMKEFKDDIFVKDFMYRSSFVPYKFKMKDFLELMAWYITEGSPGTYGQVNISQHNKKYRKEIINLIEKLGIRPTVGKRAISFSSGVVQKFLIEECGHGCRQKKFPSFIFNLSYSLRKIFLDTLMKGDGHKNGRKYTTISKQLAKDFSHLCFLNGIRTKISEHFYDKGCLRISMRDTNSCIKPENISKKKYNGDVYCVTTKKNHIIYAGRSYLNWIGQSFGPGEYYTKYRSVVCLFCYRALHDLPYEVYKGYHRVFLYIDDFIPTLARACERFMDGGVINIGGEEYRSVEELSNIILKQLGKDDKLVTYLPEDKHNIINKRPDISKARRLFNHNPTTPLEVGVRKTLDWLKTIYL